MDKGDLKADTPFAEAGPAEEGMLGLVPYVVAVAVAFWQPYLTVLICISLSVYWVATGGDA